MTTEYSKAEKRFYTIVDLEKYKTKLSNKQISTNQIANGNTDDPLIDITDYYHTGDPSVGYPDNQHPAYPTSVNLSQEQNGLKGYAYLNRNSTTNEVQTANVVKDGLTLTGRNVNFIGSAKNLEGGQSAHFFGDDHVYVWGKQNPKGQFVNHVAGSDLDGDPTTFAHLSQTRNPLTYLTGSQYQNNINAGDSSLSIHRDDIKNNNQTGFRINYNTQDKTSQDIGQIITPPHNHNQNIKGTRQIWYKTGSLYGHFRGSQGGAGGAGGSRSQGQQKKSGGRSGAAATTKHSGFIYPRGVNTNRVYDIQSQLSIGGWGGWGGNSGSTGQWGQNGTSSGASNVKIYTEQNQQQSLLSITINGTGYGTGGAGGRSGKSTPDTGDNPVHVDQPVNPDDVTNYNDEQLTATGYNWKKNNSWYPAAPGSGRHQEGNGGYSGAPGISATFRSYTLIGSRELHIKKD